MMNRIDAKAKAKSLLRGKPASEILIFGLILFVFNALPLMRLANLLPVLTSFYYTYIASRLTGGVYFPAAGATGYFSALPTILALAIFFLQLLLNAGMVRSAIQMNRGNTDVRATDTLRAFDKLVKFFFIDLCQALFLFLWGLPAVGGLVLACVVLIYGLSEGSMGFVVLSMVLLLASMIWSIFIGINKKCQYYFSYYVSEDHPEMGAMDCLRESGRLMAGHKLELFATWWSFFGWRLLDVTFFAQIFTVPYQYLTYAAIYDQLRGETEAAPTDERRWVTETAAKSAPAIEIISGEHAGSEIPLSDGTEVRIGRDPKQVNVVVSPASEQISGLHCGVRYDSFSDCYIVTDYSTNGTYTGSARLPAGSTQVRRGTVIKLASGEFMFRLD